MTYLLAKYALLFLLTLVAGIIFGRWMTQRRFVDVSESYEDLRNAATQSDASHWNKLWERVDGLAYAIGNIPAPKTPKELDFHPVTSKLDHLVAKIDSISQQPDVILTPVEAANSGPATLKTAKYGDKDNLRLIFGVGPMLEGLLNDHGIFYFWQIANWTDHDIDIMDQRLDTFKGRIVRDNWLDQASQLSREPTSVQQPTEMRVSA